MYRSPFSVLAQNGGRRVRPKHQGYDRDHRSTATASKQRSMANLPPSVPVGNVMSAMFAAALPVRLENGRPPSEASQQMLQLVAGTKSEQTPRAERQESMGITRKWNPKAWDSYEYRSRVPALSQHDREKSTRKARDW